MAIPFRETFFDGRRLPLVIRPQGGARIEALIELLASRRAELSERLASVGALLFRGFPLTGAAELEQVVAAFADGAPLAYAGGDTPRSRVRGLVYTSTECPARVRILLHNEMSYLAAHPRQLFFLCETPAREGGETTLADGRAVFRALDPAIRESFVARGVRYTTRYRGPDLVFDLIDRVQKLSKSWMEAFETERRDEVEAHCRRLELGFQWLKAGYLSTSTVRPAVLPHRLTGEPIWFNQAHLFQLDAEWVGRLNLLIASLPYLRRATHNHHAAFGDGSAIDRAALHHVRQVLDARTIAFPWMAGDLLLVDNEVCMHGRNRFRGARRVLVAMSGEAASPG